MQKLICNCPSDTIRNIQISVEIVPRGSGSLDQEVGLNRMSEYEEFEKPAKNE